ncbi:hypothetical protein UA08_00139 [Talaromyces atroroseus]|uniref:Uncharacterized protein n=1 Tax=Talaromyces atroroseus TaxID=1441469 RepID=A0A225ASK9_TALAT|nr:hypothetical protein UA08_00139 [Talaromyces atroroseus]OKL64572.1 hypothetical protein UA08_00139 [Talaromyces atroroseus]
MTQTRDFQPQSATASTSPSNNPVNVLSANASATVQKATAFVEAKTMNAETSNQVDHEAVYNAGDEKIEDEYKISAMLPNHVANVYLPLEARRHSFGTSISSSKYTENDFVCSRIDCHCDAANREETDPNESTVFGRQAEYFYRPPVLSSHRDRHMSGDSPYSYFQLQKNADAAYCEQCQFCSASSRWCGRLPSNQAIKVPRSILDSHSELDTGGLYGTDWKMQLPNATWVQEPLIVNSVQVLDENGGPRHLDSLEPAVFSNTLTRRPSREPTLSPLVPGEDLTASMESLQQTRSVVQNAAQSSMCLKYFRDIRCTREERWAIEEGSLVISIPPSFVDLPQQLIAPDEFELRAGEVFVVCLMFADMWALCARHRLSNSIASVQGATALQNSDNFKFLPLCAVTLAANYGPFNRRCATYKKRFPFSTFYPSGGNRIQPPERKESLEASRKILNGPADQMPTLPKMVYELCKAPVKLPHFTEYVSFEPPIKTRNSYATLKRLLGRLVFKEESTSKRETPGEEEGQVSDIPTEKQDHKHYELSGEGGQDPSPVDTTKRKMQKRKSIRNFFRSSKCHCAEEESI